MTGVQLDPRDAMNLYASTDQVMASIVTACVVDTGSMNSEDMVEWFRRRTDGQPNFRRRLCRVPGDLDCPYWVDDADFDVRNHIEVRSFSGRPGWDAVAGEIARQLDTGLDMSRPPWGVQLITGVSEIPGVPDGATVAIVKMHHAAVDGVGMAELLCALLGDAPAAVAENTAGAVPEGARRVTRALVRLPLNIGRLISAGAASLAASRMLKGEVARGEIRLCDGNRPRTRFNTAVTPDTVVEVVDFDLGAVRELKSSVDGATVNDVVMTVIAGALAEYLAAAGEVPPASLAATVPFSTRGIRESNSANQLSMSRIDLCTHEPAPIARLNGIRASTRDAKQRQRSAATERAGKLEHAIPPWLVRTLIAVSPPPPAPSSGKPVSANTTISNVPFGPANLSMFGAPVVNMFMLSPVLPGFGLIHFVSSYGNRLTISVIVERSMMPDPADYAKLLRRSLDELVSATR
ncbi:wax ester/triacylglycerol synthase domain-containing protein [Rhodococcus sp. NPDC058481]|uniref:wax ester/triacylglycerol synthase domain-containing protein n=1 Tax=unclassified Rhodococcus (in: high G+C Gram-positive bacteria) TaxID=192944 RepID=UPI00364A45A1